jgi:hypothetical protein
MTSMQSSQFSTVQYKLTLSEEGRKKYIESYSDPCAFFKFGLLSSQIDKEERSTITYHLHRASCLDEKFVHIFFQPNFHASKG